MDSLNTYIAPKNVESPGLKLAADNDIKKAAKDFEAVFIAEMFRPVFDSMEVDEMFGGGHAEKVYKSMLVDEYGKQMSAAGGVGLAQHVEKELLRLQEFKQQ